MSMNRPLAWIAAVVLGGCAAVPRAAPAADAAEPAAEYRVRSRDVLKVVVFEQPELSLSLRTGDDGLVEFPLIGPLEVIGRTERQIQRELTARLSDGFLIRPQVWVNVEQYRDFVYVTGAVMRPGSVAFEPGLTVVKAIAMAGGMAENAGWRIAVRGQGGAAPERPAEGFELVRPNDVIVVKESLF